MPEDRGMSRRKVLGIGAATLASTALSDVLSPAAALAGGAPGKVGYFARFGVDEALIREHPGHGAGQGRRLRRPLLPAPRLEQLRRSRTAR